MSERAGFWARPSLGGSCICNGQGMARSGIGVGMGGLLFVVVVCDDDAAYVADGAVLKSCLTSFAQRDSLALSYLPAPDSIAQTRRLFLPIGTALRCSCAISQLNSILQHVRTKAAGSKATAASGSSSVSLQPFWRGALGCIALFS